MKEMKINERVIELLQNNQINSDYWLSQLGYADIVFHRKTDENELIYDFYEHGKILWDSYKYKLRDLICDTEKGEPKFLVNETVGGDIREFLQATIPLLVTAISVPVAIAIPLVCLILKKGLNKFCSIEWKG